MRLANVLLNFEAKISWLAKDATDLDYLRRESRRSNRVVDIAHITSIAEEHYIIEEAIKETNRYLRILTSHKKRLGRK